MSTVTYSNYFNKKVFRLTQTPLNIMKGLIHFLKVVQVDIFNIILYNKNNDLLYLVFTET